MNVGGALPGISRRDRGDRGLNQQHGLAGWYRAVVETVVPLTVSVPALTGAGQAVPAVPSVTFAPPLEPGAPVWVVCIEGNRDNLLVASRRQL